MTKKQNAAKSGVLLYIWYGKTVCNLLLFLVYRLHAYLSIVLHHFLSQKSQKTVYLSKEAAFHFENVKKCKCSRARKEKTPKSIAISVFFFENQIELRAISAGFDLNPKLGQTLTQKFVVVKDFVLVVTGALRVRLVSAEQTALRSQIAGNLQIR